VALDPKPVVELVVDTSKLVEPLNVIVPPPSVKLVAERVTDEAEDGPPPCV